MMSEKVLHIKVGDTPIYIFEPELAIDQRNHMPERKV